MKDPQRPVYILPNLFTSGSLFLGFYAMIHAINITLRGEQNYKACALALIGAAMFDMMDGRVARKTNTASRFGVEYDSLSDLVSFGVAPALIIYLWTLKELGRIGWLGAFLYLACGALRLARFNIQVTGVEKKFFQGLPIPMAAMMICGAILIWEGKPIEDIELFFSLDVRFFLLILTYLLAGMMVSTIPYRSFKTLSLTTSHPFYYLVLVVVGLMFFGIKPWWSLFSLGCVYLLSGPVEKYVLAAPVRVFQRVKRHRRVKKALDRIDELASVTPKTIEDENQVKQERKVHPLKRS